MFVRKHFTLIVICCIVVALALCFIMLNNQTFGILGIDKVMGYEDKIFNKDIVHTIDIVIDDWDSFIESCENEEYTLCSLVIDDEAIKNVGIRAKGNTSLSSVKQMGSERYSFKIEFDQYDSTKNYYGLDKLCLNNIIQDNSYMKDYLTYTLMDEFGVDSPLCSYTYITVNGEPWGLYLAVEAVEDSFLERNYGTETGDLYKPDTLSMGGGRGAGKNFDIDKFLGTDSDFSFDGKSNASSNTDVPDMGNKFPNGNFPSNMPEDFDFENFDFENFDFENFDFENFEGDFPNPPGDMNDFDPSNMDFGDKGGFGMGSTDVKLQYTDDNISSYENIFNSAKTVVNNADKKRLINSLKNLSEGNIEESIDVDEVMRYLVVHNFVVNGDSYTGSMIHNYYLHEKDGLLSMIPWDYNLAFGGFQGNNASSAVNDPIDSPLSVSGDGTRPMADWVINNDEYNQMYHEYFQEFLNTIDINSIIDDTYELIASYVESDPTKFCTYEEFNTAYSTLKEFINLRIQSVQGQLDGTIPSTDDGQSADNSTLIDASSINISDMGSMGNMGGGGFGGNRDFSSKRNNNSSSTDTNLSTPSDINQFSPNDFEGPINSNNSIPPTKPNQDPQSFSKGTATNMPESMGTPPGMPTDTAGTPPDMPSGMQQPPNTEGNMQDFKGQMPNMTSPSK